MKFYSQDGQDEFIVKLFKGKRNGIFLDIGAFDGVYFSNTYALEQSLSWTGICVEPNPLIFEKLQLNRECICLNSCISEKESVLDFLAVTGWGSMLSGILHMCDERHLKRVKQTIDDFGGEQSIIEVKSCPLSNILEQNKITQVDYCNIDVEGGEISVLKSIDFSKVLIKIFTIENNYGSPLVGKYLSQFGYKFITKLGEDEVYELNSKRYGLILWYRFAAFRNKVILFAKRRKPRLLRFKKSK